MEGHLQTFNYHTNGFDPTHTRSSMLGTYMGILHYDRIEAAVKARPQKNNWLVAAEVWEHDHGMTGSPTFKLLALEVRRQVEKLGPTSDPATDH